MRARTNVILAGKCDSCRYSTTRFKENVVAKTSYQMLGILSLSDREKALLPSTEIGVLTFVVKNVQWSFPRCLFLENYRRENLKLNVLVVVLVLEFKVLYCTDPREHELIYLLYTMNGGKEKRLN